MIQTPTPEDIVNSFIENIRATIPEASTTPVSVIREALINPSATQIGFLFDFAKRVSVLQDIFQATGVDLDTLAATYNIARRSGGTATGIVYLDLSQLENVDTITVNTGTVVRSTLSSAQTTSFYITGNFTFSIIDRAVFESNASAIRDQLNSIGWNNVRLVTSVPVRASSAGTAGNVGAYTLRNINTANINNVVNISPTSGGTSTESDDSLRQRIIAVFAGNSTGTEAGLLAAATATSSVTGAFLVKSGDPLMTRDGSVYDDQGNLVTPGHGRAVDIYIQGSSIATDTDTVAFELKDSNNFLAANNSILVGQPADGNFGSLPITSITSITGNESTAAFTQGILVTDEQGNILVEGNFALIKDVEADKYFIVENLITRERKLATSLSPTNTKYTIVETFTTSDFANSPFSQDKVLFLKNTVDVSDETISKGQFNGADQLRFSNVSQVNNIIENKTITDTVKIKDLIPVSGGVAIKLPHVPVLNVNSIFHTRLGINIDFELQDTQTGLVRLIGRTPPRQDDILVVEYVWQKSYYEDLNFALSGDTINWVLAADENNRANATLLESEALQGETTLALQPNLGSELLFTVGGMVDRQIIESTIEGQATQVTKDQLTFAASDPFTFAIASTANIGRLFKVTNATQGFEYNLTGYKLASNKLDPRAGVESSLLSQQFLLSERANVDSIIVGDKFVLGQPSRTLSWSSESDFTNSIENNLAPIYDATKLDFTAGGIILKTPLLDDITIPVALSGVIAQDVTLSGIIEITDTLIINEGVVVTLLPNTTIKVRPTSQLQNQVTFAQRTTFDGYLVQQDTLGNTPTTSQFEEFQYIYFKPEGFNSNFLTIINDQGQLLSIRFEEDILTKVVTGPQAIFYVAGRQIDPSFNADLESTLDLNDVTSTIKATLLGGRYGVSGTPKFTAAKIESLNKYYVLLERTPITSDNVQQDFTLFVDGDNSIVFQRFSYDSTLNALIVDGDILEIDGYGDEFAATDYIASYLISQEQRLGIIVEGTLRAIGGTPQTSILITSAAANATPGDWEGITFTAKSHTTNPKTVLPSELSNVRILYANVGLNIQASDVNVQNCIIRDCLDTGINMASSNQPVAQYTTDDFDLLVVGNPFVKFTAEPRVGFSSTDDVRVARYPIPDNLVTADGFLPPVGSKLTNTSYIVNLVEPVDYKVFIDYQEISAIDTTQPSDGYVDHSLQYNQDFFIEFDINTGYSLVFLYTAGSQKRRRVYDLIIDLDSKLQVGKINVDYFKSISNGLIYDNLLINHDTAIVIDTLTTTSINRNTIDNVRLGIVANQAIAEIRNNLITNYSSAPLSIDPTSLIRVRRNDFYSQQIIDQEQVALLDTDVLLRNISTATSTLLVRTPSKFKVGATITIDQEQMLVQAVNDDSIIVSRGRNNTTFAEHTSGSQIEIYQLNQIFNVTGINGDFCQLVETDINGQALANTIPVQMRLLSNNTFRATFPVNRRADFYYKFVYGQQNNLFTEQTLVKKFPKDQMGVGVNDVVSLLHEIPLNSVVYTPNNENYAADPLYIQQSSANYSFSPLSSPASRQNPMYGSLVVANPIHKYVGFIDISLTRTLGTGTTRIPVPYEPLIVNSFAEVEVVGIDTLNQGVVVAVSQFSFSVTTSEADNGAVGVFIVDSNLHPAGVSIAGQYSVQYVRPVDLGTTLPPYYIEADISYVVDAGTDVVFNTLAFEKDDVGGQVEFAFQIADSIENLQVAALGNSSSSSPISIEQITTTNVGRAIQINAKLKGNDSSFASDLSYVFPTLQSFSLSYVPAKDSTEYKVLSLSYDRTQDETNILIDKPISTSTYEAVGSSDTLELIVRKKSDNFDPADEFLLANIQGIAVGDTFVKATGNLTIRKTSPLSTDVIKVDYLSYADQNETLYFVQDSSQYTKNTFSQVYTISHLITQDRQSVLPTTQTIEVSNLTQPNTGDNYQASYAFQAPLEGETLTISYNFNSTIREASDLVEIKKSIYSDVLLKQMKDVAARIAIALDVIPGSPPLSVQSQVSLAISNLFTTTLVDAQSERRLDASDIIRATSDIAGIEDIRVTTLSRNLITGEVQDPLTFGVGENALLEEGSPRINTTQNGKAIPLGSS